MNLVLLQVKIPKTLRRELKLQAACEDRCVSAWVVQALVEKLKNSDKSRRLV